MPETIFQARWLEGNQWVIVNDNDEIVYRGTSHQCSDWLDRHENPATVGAGWPGRLGQASRLGRSVAAFSGRVFQSHFPGRWRKRT
jgi:hypothetical protein